MARPLNKSLPRSYSISETKRASSHPKNNNNDMFCDRRNSSSLKGERRHLLETSNLITKFWPKPAAAGQSDRWKLPDFKATNSVQNY